MNTWLKWLSLVLIVAGLVLLPVRLLLGVVLIVVGVILLLLTVLARKGAEVPWRALSELEPSLRERILEKARGFADMTSIQSALYPKVAASHTRLVNVLGVNPEGEQVLVGVEPATTEVVKMVRLCPRKQEEATEVRVEREQAEASCREFLRNKDLSLPEGYILDEARVVSLGTWKRWRFVWRHVQNLVRVLPDFVTMEVNAAEPAKVISYSKVDHGIEVPLTPLLQPGEALERVRKTMPEVGPLEMTESSLAVVYPNNFFRRQVWEWSDNQALCWILKLYRQGKHALDVWVDALTGEIRGGELCHLYAPQVYGIDALGSTHMQSHLNNVWTPYLEKMKLGTGAMSWTNTAAGFTEPAIVNAISGNRFFIVEGHGGTTASAEAMRIAEGTGDAQSLTPDEVPANNLSLAFLDVCESGHDGSGLDFKDTFISNGADVFVGFDDSMCAWAYEERLLHYLAQGRTLENAHNLADAEVSPWYKIVITRSVSCLNKVRMAPILVDVDRSPAGAVSAGSTFTVTSSICNREDVDHTAAANVQAKLNLPAGFSIVSGPNPQTVGNVSWGYASTNVAWTVKAPNAAGSYTLDVEVWSDNLGAAVADPDDPYHKLDVEVFSHFALLVHTFYAVLARWLLFRRTREMRRALARRDMPLNVA